MSEIDPVSNVVLSRTAEPIIQAGDEGLDVFKKLKRHIAFRFCPGTDSGYLFTSTTPEYSGKVEPFPQDFKLAPLDMPGSLGNVGPDYELFVSELFREYNSLEEYKYPASLGGIGLQLGIEAAKANQARALYMTLESMLGNLELLINKSADNVDADADEASKALFSERIGDWMDFYNVLSFIRAVCFLNDLILGRDLVFWLNRADADNPPASLLSLLIDLDAPYREDTFFRYLNRLLVRGLFDAASSLLLESDYKKIDNDFIVYVFDSIIKLIRDYQIVHDISVSVDLDGTKTSVFTTDVSTEQKAHLLFKNFKREVVALISDVNLQLGSDLPFEHRDLLLKLKKTLSALSGSRSAIIAASETWTEAFVGMVLFELPTSKLLQEYVEAALEPEEFEVNEIEVWEVLCHSLIRNENFLLVLRSLEQFNADTAAFLSVLLDAKGYLKDYNRFDYFRARAINELYDMEDEDVQTGDFFARVSDLTISQYLLYNHAMNCFGNRNLVPNGVAILKSLNLQNFKQILTEFLPYNYHCETQNDREWLLSVCAENKLLYLLNNLYHLFGLDLFNEGKVLQALSYLVNTGDYALVSKKIWEVFEQQLFEKYVDGTGNSELEVLVLQDGQNPELVSKLSQEQKDFLRDYTPDPVLQRFLSPCFVLLKYMSAESMAKYDLSKGLLIQLIQFKYTPTGILCVLLLYLLKYFSLNISSDLSSSSIGLSIFETSELTSLIKTLNGLQKKLENPHENEAAMAHYSGYIKLCHTSLHREYAEFDIEIPSSLPDLIRALRTKISWELLRKYLE